MGEGELFLRWTQLPNVLMDYVIPLLRESEEKVLLYILRRTYGWKDGEDHRKEQDAISFSQFVGGRVNTDGKLLDFGCGVTRPKVAEALAFLQVADLVLRVDTSAGKTYAGRGSVGQYRLNLQSEMVNKVNQYLQDPENARKLMVNFLNQCRIMVKNLNQSRREARELKQLQKNGKESKPLKNGKESKPEMVNKVNHSSPASPSATRATADVKKSKEKKQRKEPPVATIVATTPTPRDEFPPDDMRHVWPTGNKRVPKEFSREPTEEMFAWATTETPHVDVRFEHGAFIDYTFPKPHHEWYAAWRGWMRRAEREAKRELARQQPRVFQKPGPTHTGLQQWLETERRKDERSDDGNG